MTSDGFAPLPAHYDRCFGCGQGHPTGLKLSMEGAGEQVRGTFTVTEHHQGAPGLSHGGVLASALDEAMGFLLYLLRTPAVTAHLEVDFRAPVPVGTVLTLEAEVDRLEGRKIFARTRALLDDGTVAVEGSALFLKVGLEHFTRHHPPEPDLPQPYNP